MTATKLVTDAQKAAEKAAKEAAEREVALNAADTEFREAVAKAGEVRQKVREKHDPGTNLAERAWNDTKADEDPEYRNVAITYRQKLDDVVAAVKATGNADVVGLEAFEARVVELLAEAGTPAPVHVAPTVPDSALAHRIAAVNAEKAEKAKVKK